MGRAEARASRVAAPALAIVAGMGYGVAEFLRQLAVPSPSGVPGDSGGSVWLFVAVGVAVAAGPAVLVSSVFPIRSRFGEWAALSFGAWPFAAAGLWRVLDRAGALVERDGWTPVWFLGPGLLLAAVAAAAALPLVRRWPGPLRIPRRMAALVLLVAIAFAGRGLRPGPAPEGHPGTGPNLLLVTIDTLRRDALASYGGSSATALDSLGGTAHEGWAVSSWTQPSMASLFSGTVPTGHGSDRDHGPDPAVSWWPEQVAATGARTAAFVTNPYLRRRFGFDRGFGRFDHAEERPWLEPVARTVLAEWVQAALNEREDADRADRIVARAERWLAEAPPDRPWFLWVHLLDPHLPYHLRGGDGRCQPDETPAWLEPLGDLVDAGGFHSLHEIRDGSLVLGGDQQAALRVLYQTEVGYAAWWGAGLVRAAEEASQGRGLVWAVTSDHGEEFFEEGGFEHGHTLADPVIRVPMLASGLGDVPRPMRLIDLGPAILEALDARTGFDPARGTQLLESDTALASFALGSVPALVDCDRPPLLAEGLLYGIERTRVYVPGGPGFERREDSGAIELLPGCATAAGGAAFDWRTLDLWRERRTISPLGIEVDDDLRRRLRALGYVN